MHGGHHCVHIVNFPILHFVAMDVVLERGQKAFGVLWGQHNARFHFSFGHIGHHSDKIYYKFRIGVRYNGQIRVNAFGNFLGEFDVDGLLLGYSVSVVSHNQ